jgi:leader peptidase (prepilin peptidase)/N-methyltransferase
MSVFVVLFIFILGTLIGSFLNVVILRYNTGKNILAMGERSMCFSCGKTLQWYELVPVFSFLFQRARCKGCGSKISWQYPLVEFATGVIFVAIFLKNFGDFPVDQALAFSMPFFVTLILTLFELVIWSILMVITLYDLRHKIIPDGMVFAFIGLALFYNVIYSTFYSTVYVAIFPQASVVSIWNAILAGSIFFSFFAGMWLISSGRWLGFGDAKLVVGVGLFLGLAKGLSALVLSFWVGAVVSIALVFGGRALSFLSLHAGEKSFVPKVIRESRLRERLSVLTMKSEVPFAPFIILGTLIAFFCETDIFQISSFLVF